MELAKHYCHTTAEIRWSAVEWGGTGLLFIAYKVKFVAWAYESDPDRAPLKEVLGGQYNHREGGRQVLRHGAKGRRRSRSCRCSKDPCAQKVSGGRTDPSPKYRW